MKKWLITSLMLTGCATQGIERIDQNQMIKEFYASVASITPVKLSSNVKTGIVVGAGAGVIDELDGNHEDMIAGGLAGAIVGGLFTALFEGSNDAYQYNLISADEGKFAVIQKKLIAQETDCLKVRVAADVQFTSVPKEMCQGE